MKPDEICCFTIVVIVITASLRSERPRRKFVQYRVLGIDLLAFAQKGSYTLVLAWEY